MWTGLNATDKDYLQILPTPTMQAFIQAMQQCGFQLMTVDVEKGQLLWQRLSTVSIGLLSRTLKFKPTQLFNSINEVEVSFVAEQHQTHVLLEVDRKFRGDGFNSLTIPHQQANPALLANEIRRMLGL